METKKIVLPTIIAVVFLIVLTVGATYAYFRVQTNNNSSSATINTTTASVGSITITNVSPNISINLTAADMIDSGQDIPYYAQAGNNQAGTTVLTTPTVASINVTGEGTYRCEYTLTLSASSIGTNMFTTFRGMTGRSDNQIVLTINTETTTTLDFNNNSLSFPKTISGTYTGLTQNNGASITAQLKIVNKTGLNQTALAGTSISISIQPTRFDCVPTA